MYYTNRDRIKNAQKVIG